MRTVCSVEQAEKVQPQEMWRFARCLVPTLLPFQLSKAAIEKKPLPSRLSMFFSTPHFAVSNQSCRRPWNDWNNGKRA